MARLHVVRFCFLVAALLFLSSGIIAAATISVAGTAVDERLERSCHRAIKNRSPHGQRALTTFTYRQEARYADVLTGSVKTRYAGKAWLPIQWMCRVHPTSGRVLRVEFTRMSGGARLLAAASSL